MGEAVPSDSEPRVKVWRCDDAPQTNSFWIAMSVAVGAFIDDCDNSEDILAVDVLKNPTSIGDGTSRSDVSKSMRIEAGGRVDIGEAPRGD